MDGLTVTISIGRDDQRETLAFWDGDGIAFCFNNQLSGGVPVGHWKLCPSSTFISRCVIIAAQSIEDNRTWTEVQTEMLVGLCGR